jgi:hypothetical protein
VSFKSADERRNTVLNVIRYGDEDEVTGTEKVRVAAALVERYVPNGRAISLSMLNAINDDFEKVPAEVLAEYLIGQLKGDSLFRLGRTLEFEGFSSKVRGFDELALEEKSFLGMLMDFAGLERARFADAWKRPQVEETTDIRSKNEEHPLSDSPGPLFD